VDEQEKWQTSEAFCYQDPVPHNMRYVHCNIYKRLADLDSVIVVGIIAVSDNLMDYWIAQLFDDKDISDFFMNEIAVEVGDNMSEAWLVQKYFNQKPEDKFFFSMPVVDPAPSARFICDGLTTLWAAEQYTFDASREQEILDI
jgi:hypothetical protein